MYVGTDDIKKLIDSVLNITEENPDDLNAQIQYGVIRGYLYAIQDILTKEKDNG